MFFKKKNKGGSAADFWSWFSANHKSFLFIRDVEESERDRLMDELLVELHKFSDQLFFEIGIDEDQNPEFVVTANGIVEAFPKVEELIAAAPQIDEWKFTAFKPPLSAGVSINYGGVDFDPNKIIFIPLFNEEAPDQVGLHVCYAELTEENKNLYVGATYILLDTLLGEKSTTLDIAYMDIIRTPEDIGNTEFKHLSDIKEFVDMIKGR